MPTRPIIQEGPQPTDVMALCQRFLGVEPTLHPQFDRAQVRLQDRVQGRLDVNNAPEYMVRRYAELMREATFPPPLYTGDAVPVDGNTRTKAYAQRNVRYIPAYVLEGINFTGADADMIRKLKLLSLALNARNGLALDEKELLDFAAELMITGASDEDIVGQTGVKLAKVTALRDRQRANGRLVNLGIDTKDFKLTDTVLRAFGKPNVMRLDDEQFKGLVELSKEAGLSKGGSISALATSIHEAPTPEAKRERLARERAALEPQILAIRNQQPFADLTDWLRKTIEKVLAYPVTSFIEHNTEKTAEYVERIDKALDKFAEIRDEQLSRPVAEQTTTAQAEATTVPVQ
jgi:hypothetical protein